MYIQGTWGAVEVQEEEERQAHAAHPRDGREGHNTHAHARPYAGGSGVEGRRERSGGPAGVSRPGRGSPLEAVGDGKQQLALLEGLHLLEGLVVQG